MIGDPEIGDQGDREVDIQEPCKGIFPLPLAQISQGDVEAQRENPDESHEHYAVMVQDNGFPPVGSSPDYNGEIRIGEQGRGRMGRGGPPPEVILIFRGTHQVMSAEKSLKKARVPMRLIPVPRRLTSDCGLAIRIATPDRKRARKVLSRARILPLSVHILLNGGEYEEVPF